MQQIQPAPDSEISGEPDDHPKQAEPSEHGKSVWTRRHRFSPFRCLRTAKAITGGCGDPTNATAPNRDNAHGSAVAKFAAELNGARHEGPGSASDFSAAAVEENSFGYVEAFRAADDLAPREQMAFGDGPQKIELERRGHDKEICDDRLDGEKCRVVQRFEIHRSVNRASRMMEVLTHGHLNLRAPFFGNA